MPLPHLTVVQTICLVYIFYEVNDLFRVYTERPAHLTARARGAAQTASREVRRAEGIKE